MCVCICVCVFSKTVDVSIPDAGSTMQPEQRDMSHGLSTTDISAAGLNASGGSRVHKVGIKDATFILTCLLLLLDCWKEIRRNCRALMSKSAQLLVRSFFHLSGTPKIYR